ncbi:MAG TPA: hypothetical protein VFJ82_08305 [Longimicrobium sp.]|nr:hypothetical protein [Longimicrobium sp.]
MPLMAGEPSPAAPGADEGVTGTARLALLAVVAAVQAVPGYTLLASPEWQPPDAGMFRLTAAVGGAAFLALVLMARKRVLRLRARAVVAGCAGVFVLALALLYAYHAVLQRRVIMVPYGKPESHEYPVLVPFGVSRWATGEVLAEIQKWNDPRPATPARVTPIHLQNTLSQDGPDLLKEWVPQRWWVLTFGALWLMYTMGLGLIVLGFGTAAVRLGVGIAQKRRARANPPAAPDSVSPPATPATDAAASAGASASKDGEEPRRAAEVVPAGTAAVAMDGHASSNGKGLGEPVMLRVELRAPAWAVAGAAAALAWAAYRLAPRRDEPRRPPPRPPRGRDRGGRP